MTDEDPTSIMPLTFELDEVLFEQAVMRSNPMDTRCSLPNSERPRSVEQGPGLSAEVQMPSVGLKDVGETHCGDTNCGDIGAAWTELPLMRNQQVSSSHRGLPFAPTTRAIDLEDVRSLSEAEARSRIGARGDSPQTTHTTRKRQGGKSKDVLTAKPALLRLASSVQNRINGGNRDRALVVRFSLGALGGIVLALCLIPARQSSAALPSPSEHVATEQPPVATPSESVSSTQRGASTGAFAVAETGAAEPGMKAPLSDPAAIAPSSISPFTLHPLVDTEVERAKGAIMAMLSGDCDQSIRLYSELSSLPAAEGEFWGRFLVAASGRCDSAEEKP